MLKTLTWSTVAAAVLATGSSAFAQCSGFCGGQSSAGCFCDNLCCQYLDCCGDITAICGISCGGGDCAPGCPTSKENVACLSGAQADNAEFVAQLRQFPGASGFCTAWVIAAPDLMLTNNHCGVGVGDVVAFNFECSDCTGGSVEPVQEFQITQVVSTNNAQDWTIFRVNGNVAAQFGQPTIDASPLAIGLDIYEIHHAEGDVKGTDDGQVLTGLINVSCPGSIQEHQVSVIASQGASGSPVFRSDNNCVTAVCNCGPPCSPGFVLPMSIIWPNIQNVLDNAGGTYILCGQDPGGEGDCDGFCGGQAAAGCFCDDLCCLYIDCCDDLTETCGISCDPDPTGDCDGFCGGQSAAGCFCDDLCCLYIDCCDDLTETCGITCEPDPTGDCDGFCGGQAAAGCFCDDLCCLYIDCCDDLTETCGISCDPDPTGDCDGFCGGQAAAGCFCDDLCCLYIDCCDDLTETCGITCDPDPTGDCVGFCGGQSAAGCFCDDLCCLYIDCCDDLTETCGITCEDPSDCVGDLDGDGDTDSADLNIVLGAFGTVFDSTDLNLVLGDFGCTSGDCNGFCGGQAAAGCFCDALCCLYLDCCDDAGSSCGVNCG